MAQFPRHGVKLVRRAVSYGCRRLANAVYREARPENLPIDHDGSASIKAAGIADDWKGSAIGKTGQLSARSMLRGDVRRMVRRRASDAGIETAIGCHTFRATGITEYLTNGGRIEVAQRMAGHSNAKTIGLYDRRNDDISVGEVERIGI